MSTPRGTSQPPMTLTLTFGGKTPWDPLPCCLSPSWTQDWGCPPTWDRCRQGCLAPGRPSWGLGQVPHGDDGQHGLLPHRGDLAVSGFLLQQHLWSTAGWDGSGRRSLPCLARTCGAGRAQVPPSQHPLPTQHPVVPSPTLGRAVPTTEPQAGQETCKCHQVQVPAPAGPPRWLWSISKDGDPEQCSSPPPCVAKPSPVPRAVLLPTAPASAWLAIPSPQWSPPPPAGRSKACPMRWSPCWWCRRWCRWRPETSASGPLAASRRGDR